MSELLQTLSILTEIFNRNEFNDFTTMLQLDLFSSRNLNLYIEYYVTMLVEEYIKMGIHFVNEAKWGLVTAYSLPEHCRTNYTMSLDTFYEPVCNKNGCSSNILNFDVTLKNSDICMNEDGKRLMNRIFIDYFYEMFSTCEEDYKYVYHTDCI